MTKPDAEPMTNIATDVIEGYKTGLAGGPMGFVSAAFDCGWLTGAHERAALSEQPAPIDMVLHCPVCGVQHIDAPESHPVFVDHVDDAVLWGNPPHRSHLCHGCGHIWRPADVATNGVAAIKTRGKNDSPMGACAHPVAHPAPVERVTLSDTKPLDDPRLQQLFGDAIEGALAFGYQGENAAPPGHWLERFWHLGRAEAEKTLAATPPPMPARLNDQRIVELMRPLADDALIRPHVIAAARAAIAEYERINGITPAQGKETQG